MQKGNTLRTIPGQKIRRQIFNIPIYLILSLDTALLFALTADSIQDPSCTFMHWLENTTFFLTLSAGLILPLSILSVLNWFCFGEVICVLDDRGLHHREGFISWSQIKQAVYEPDFPSEVGRQLYCCNELHLTVKSFQKEERISLDHAPLLLMRNIKKHCPGIQCKMTGWGITMIVCFSFGIGIISALGALLD